MLINQSVFPATVNEHTSFPVSLISDGRINPRFYFIIVMSKNQNILNCISLVKITSEFKLFLVYKQFFFPTVSVNYLFLSLTFSWWSLCFLSSEFLYIMDVVYIKKCWLKLYTYFSHTANLYSHWHIKPVIKFLL